MTTIVTYATFVCDVHDRAPRPGYIACAHVLDSRVPIAHFATAGKGELGLMFCSDCYNVFKILARLELICPACVEDLLRARELKP